MLLWALGPHASWQPTTEPPVSPAFGLQSVERFKEICMQVVEQLLGNELDYAKLAATAETVVSASDIKASIAAMDFILSR